MTKKKMMINKGRCYCRQVTFTVTGALRNVLYCHCSQCRKLSGHIFAASAAPLDNITIKGDVKWFQSSPGYRRGTCPNCATPLFWQDMSSPTLSIIAGAFDDEVELTAEAHIFCADKAGYYEINDTLAHYKHGYKQLTEESN